MMDAGNKEILGMEAGAYIRPLVRLNLRRF